MSAAVFDINDLTIAPGWATYHADTPAHPHVEALMPDPPNGHSPSNYGRCACGVAVKWFVVGQHRYGSVDATHSYWTDGGPK